jgi:hypothetical protein
MDYN